MQQDNEFSYNTRVSFYDTDAMGVMHHAAYLKKFEDARVAWLRENGFDQYHFPKKDMVLAVISAELKYIKPSFFDQVLKVQLNVKKTRLKLSIEYVMYNESNEKLATGQTVHVPLDKDLKLTDYPKQLLTQLERIKNG